MQNKPNFAKAQMNISVYSTMNYKNFIPLAGYKNKPNSKPIKPNLRRARMNVNLTLTKDYKKTMFSQPKKTNPIQTQFLQRPKSLARKSGHTHFNKTKKNWTIPNEVVRIKFLDELSI